MEMDALITLGQHLINATTKQETPISRQRRVSLGAHYIITAFYHKIYVLSIFDSVLIHTVFFLYPCRKKDFLLMRAFISDVFI